MEADLWLGLRAKRDSQCRAEAKPEGNPQADVPECRDKRDAQCEAQPGTNGQAASGLFNLVFRCFLTWFYRRPFKFLGLAKFTPA